MYESPIRLCEVADQITEHFNKELEAYTLNVLKKYDIAVDKEELTKALEYDRKQYEKGYKEGFYDARELILNTITNEIAAVLRAAATIRGSEV